MSESADQVAERIAAHAKSERKTVILDTDTPPRRIWSDGAFMELGETFPQSIEEMLKAPTRKASISRVFTDLEARNEKEWQDARFSSGVDGSGLASVNAVSSEASAQIDPLYRDYILARYPKTKLRIKDAISPILVVADDRICAAVMPNILI